MFKSLLGSQAPLRVFVQQTLKKAYCRAWQLEEQLLHLGHARGTVCLHEYHKRLDGSRFETLAKRKLVWTQLREVSRLLKAMSACAGDDDEGHVTLCTAGDWLHTHCCCKARMPRACCIVARRHQPACNREHNELGAWTSAKHYIESKFASIMMLCTSSCLQFGEHIHLQSSP